jgi:hypothetical protein
VTAKVLFRRPSVGEHAVQSLQLATQSTATGQAKVSISVAPFT